MTPIKTPVELKAKVVKPIVIQTNKGIISSRDNWMPDWILRTDLIYTGRKFWPTTTRKRPYLIIHRPDAAID